MPPCEDDAHVDPAVHMTSFRIVARGPFSLEAAAGFAFGPTEPGSWDGLMRLAFCRDDFTGHAGVVLRQNGDAIEGTVHGDGGVAAVEAQVARILSLDQDATAWLDVGVRDPVIGELQKRLPGFARFSSTHPMRRPAGRSSVRAVSIARQPSCCGESASKFGAGFDLDGEQLVAFPTPRRLLELETVQGLPADRVPRLHAVAQATLDGRPTRPLWLRWIPSTP